MNLDIAELARIRPDIKYILVAFPKRFLRMPDGRTILLSREDLRRINSRWPLMADILLDDDYGAGRLELLDEQRIRTEDDDMALVKLLRIRPTERSVTD